MGLTAYHKRHPPQRAHSGGRDPSNYFLVGLLHPVETLVVGEIGTRGTMRFPGKPPMGES